MSQQALVFHNVYLSIHDSATPEDARALAASARRLLTDIPGVLNLVVASPTGGPLPFVDDSYAVALLIQFADEAALHAYEAHPDHVRFVEENKHLLSRVQVYNSAPAEL